MSPTTPARPQSPKYLPTPPHTPPSNVCRRRSSPPTSRLSRARSSVASLQLAARINAIEKLLSDQAIPTPPSFSRILDILARETLNSLPTWTPHARRTVSSVLRTLFIESEEWLMEPPLSAASKSASGSCVIASTKTWISRTLQSAIDDEDETAGLSLSDAAEATASCASLYRSPDITTPLLTLLKSSPPGLAPPSEWLPPLLSFLYIGAFQSDTQLQQDALQFLPALFAAYEDDLQGELEAEDVIRKELGRQPLFWVAVKKFAESDSRTVRRLADGLGRACRDAQ